MVEAADGTVRVSRPDLQRARSRRGRRPAGAVEARQAAQVQAVATAIRAGDRASPPRPTTATTTSPSGALAALREAIEAGSTVVIGYVDNHGATGERVVDPRRLDGGRLSAFDHRADDVREFAVHRITGVRQGVSRRFRRLATWTSSATPSAPLRSSTPSCPTRRPCTSTWRTGRGCTAR